MSGPAVSLQTWYFAIDDVENISADTVLFATTAAGTSTGTAGQAITHGVDTALDTYLASITPHPVTGLTRFWWSLLIGPGQAVDPVVGTSKVYGQLVSTPNKPVYDWTITIRN